MTAGGGLDLAIAIAAGVACQAVARRVRVPGIILLLGTGLLLGAAGLAWISPERLGEDLFALVQAAVAIILFEGGLNLRLDLLMHSQRVLRRLLTVGAGITVLGAGFGAYALLGWAPPLAALFASLVVVTGPTVIAPLVRELRVQERVGSLLEAEGVLIDPIGALFAVMVLEIVLAPAIMTLASGTLALAMRLALGAALGAGVGALLAWLLRSEWLPEGMGNITTLSAVLLLFEGCEALLQHSGLLSVVIAGGVVGNRPSPSVRELREFKDQITLLLIGMIFVLLAAGVRLEDLAALGKGGVGVVALLVFAIRPLAALASTWGSTLGWRERLFIGAVAPRGIVAAAVAAVTAVALETQGLAGGPELRALVFLTISGTVISAGVVAPLLVRLLGLRLPPRDGVAILGAQELAVLLGRAQARCGAPVVLIDSNPRYCVQAERAGLRSVCGNALDGGVLERAGVANAASAVGATANEALNALFARRSARFGVRNRFIALQPGSLQVTAEVTAQMEAEPLFERVHDLERWNVRARRGDLIVEDFELAPGGRGYDPSAGERTENMLFLAIERGKRCHLMTPAMSLAAGDRAVIAIFAPARDDVLDLLSSWGWKPVESEARTEATRAGSASEKNRSPRPASIS